MYELNFAGVYKYIIHARIAIRGKLNAKDNLNIPPLDHNRVFKLKKKFKRNVIIINGGFKNTNNGKEKALDGYDLKFNYHLSSKSNTDLFVQLFECENPNC